MSRVGYSRSRSIAIERHMAFTLFMETPASPDAVTYGDMTLAASALGLTLSQLLECANLAQRDNLGSSQSEGDADGVEIDPAH